MKLGHPVRLLGVLLISVAAFLIAFEPVAFPGGPTTPRFQTPRLHLNLGLDLRGGSHIVLQAKATPETPISNDAMDGVLKVIRNRIDQLGVAEPVITRQGRDRIVAELPGIENPQRAIELIGKTALLEFVDTGSTSLPRGAAWTGPDTAACRSKRSFSSSSTRSLTSSARETAWSFATSACLSASSGRPASPRTPRPWNAFRCPASAPSSSKWAG